MQVLLQDIRYGVRQLRKSPGFTVVAVLTLALGIGVNTTIFSFVNALLFRPPSGVEATNRLVSLWNRMPNGHEMEFSYPDYIYFRDHNEAFSSVIAYSSDPERSSWSQSGQSRLVGVRLVSGNYFAALGIKPIMGRIFLPEEDVTASAHPVVVLSYRFWQRELNADPAILGKTVTLAGHRFTAIGVAPANFVDLEPGFETDVWAPLTMQKEITPGNDLLQNRTGYWIFVVGRLKPGVTREQAQANMSVLAQQLAQAHPDTNKDWDAAISPLTGLDPEARGYVVAFGALLMVVVGMVLLMACANAANLLLAKASGRWREMAIRSALGAKRSRILRQVITESTLVALLAGGVGVVFSLWAGPLLLTLKPSMLSFIQLDLPLDWRMLAFALAVSVVTGIVFGSVPALYSSKIDVAARLKDESLGSLRKSRVRSGLVVLQVAVCLVLTIGATLCLRSLLNARSIDPGFETKNRLAVELDLRMVGFADSHAKTFDSQTLDRVKALPGVRSASFTNYLPLGFEGISQPFRIEDRPEAETKNVIVGAMSVGPGYFQTMGTPLIAGREFGPQDNEKSPEVVIINEAISKRFWPGQDPVGKLISTRTDANHNPVWSEIVGVVKTGKYRSLDERAEPFLYHPFMQQFDSHATLVVRTGGDPNVMLPAIRRAIMDIDSSAPIVAAQTMREYMSVPLFPAHFTGILLGVFAALALMLAMVGLYGVIAYSVAERTHEIGIRLALGAERLDVLRLVVGQGLRLSVVGVGVGLAAALGLMRLIASLLYGVSFADPVTFVLAPFLLLLVSVSACYLPARRAMRVDPLRALRYE
jgi:putative ABC transport system permease protein